MKTLITLTLVAIGVMNGAQAESTKDIVCYGKKRAIKIILKSSCDIPRGMVAYFDEQERTKKEDYPGSKILVFQFNKLIAQYSARCTGVEPDDENIAFTTYYQTKDGGFSFQYIDGLGFNTLSGIYITKKLRESNTLFNGVERLKDCAWYSPKGRN